MICWICNKNKADSGEHKFKSSLLKKMYGKPFKQEIIFSKKGHDLKLEGSNNKKVKFPKVICQNCNNTITSLHDNAFDIFINYCYDNYDILQGSHTIDFENIYGEDWLKQKRNLYKYMAKNAGCKVVTGKLENDVKHLSDFIYNDIETNSFQIDFILKEGLKVLDLLLKQNDNEGLKFMSNSETICYLNKNNEIVYFAGMTSYNWLSITWIYTQKNYATNFDGFSRSKQKITIFPIDELPDIGNKNWFDVLDFQRMETPNKQSNYYHTLLKEE